MFTADIARNRVVWL